MINTTLFINGVWYGQSCKVHRNHSYNVKTTSMVLVGDKNE